MNNWTQEMEDKQYNCFVRKSLKDSSFNQNIYYWTPCSVLTPIFSASLVYFTFVLSFTRTIHLSLTHTNPIKNLDVQADSGFNLG